MELDGLAVKYEFVHGADWNVSGGLKSGTGQRAFKSSHFSSIIKPMNWNLPYEVTFRSMNPQGWPQLVVYCTDIDINGDE